MAQLELKLDSPESRADQIMDAFRAFHLANPQVWELFQVFAFEVIKRGRKHYSSDAICHRIRWHTDIETVGEEVKLNDHYTSLYSRMFDAVYPQHAGFFKKRRRISEDRKSYPNDIRVYDLGAAGQEDCLAAELRELATNSQKAQRRHL